MNSRINICSYHSSQSRGHNIAYKYMMLGHQVQDKLIQGNMIRKELRTINQIGLTEESYFLNLY
jgi:hypothetical protein